MKDIITALFKKFKRLISYGIVGVLNTLVDYGVFSLCYSAFGVAAGISQAAGYLSGSCCGYILNSNFTFREGKGRTKGQFFQYIGVDLLLTLISSVLMTAAEGAGINAYLAKIVFTIIIMLLHYVIFKYIVFRIKKEDN